MDHQQLNALARRTDCGRTGFKPKNPSNSGGATVKSKRIGTPAIVIILVVAVVYLNLMGAGEVEAQGEPDILGTNSPVEFEGGSRGKVTVTVKNVGLETEIFSAGFTPDRAGLSIISAFGGISLEAGEIGSMSSYIGAGTTTVDQEYTAIVTVTASATGLTDTTSVTIRVKKTTTGAPTGGDTTTLAIVGVVAIVVVIGIAFVLKRR